MSEQDNLVQELKALADDTQVNAQFADDLERILRQQHPLVNKQSKAKYTPWRVAVVILLSIGVIAFLPPARTFAVNIMSFFFATEGSSITVDISIFDTPLAEFDTLEEAESIAGFDAYVVTDNQYFITGIYATDGAIALNYSKRGLEQNNYQFTLYQYNN